MITITFNVNKINYNSYLFDQITDAEESIGHNFDNEDELYEHLWEHLDSKMIYYADQWDLLKEYTNPDDLSENTLCEAFTWLFDNVYSCIEITDSSDSDNENE